VGWPGRRVEVVEFEFEISDLRFENLGLNFSIWDLSTTLLGNGFELSRFGEACVLLPAA
jgi:hypothetical protein